MLSSLLSWSFSLRVFSGLLAPRGDARVRGADYAAGAAAYLGVGSVWALGLSLFSGVDDDAGFTSKQSAMLNAICKGFEELSELGLVNDVSNLKIIAAQPHGCSPIVRMPLNQIAAKYFL